MKLKVLVAPPPLKWGLFGDIIEKQWLSLRPDSGTVSLQLCIIVFRTSTSHTLTLIPSHENAYTPRMYRFDEWETKLLSRVQRTGHGDCHIWLGAKSSNGYGMIRVKLAGDLEPSKVIGVHRLMTMCQLRTVVPQLTFKRLICATIRCVSMKNIFVWNLTMSTSRGGLSSNTVEIILPPVLTAASRMKGTSLVHTHSEKNIIWTCKAAATGMLSFHIR